MAKAVGECVLTVVQGQGARIAGTNRMRRIVRTSSATTPFAIRRLLSGVLCIAIGFAMIFWVLYRTFLEKNPYYGGALLIFGLGPLLIGYGAHQVFVPFRRAPADDSVE